MSWKKLLSNQNGFTLVEILTAFGLLAVLTLAVMKISDNSNKVTKEMDDKDEINQLHNELSMILSNPTNCERNLGGVEIGKPAMLLGVRRFIQGVEQKVYDVGPNNPERRNRATIQRAEIRAIEGTLQNSIIDLAVTYEKPGVVFEKEGTEQKNFNRIGSQEVTRVIKLWGSRCQRRLVQHTQGTPVFCGSNKTLIEGPFTDSTNNSWMICEDCTGVNATSPIKHCSSQASSGVNVLAIAEQICRAQGSTFDTSTGVCTPKTTIIDSTLCIQMGGNWNNNNCELTANQCTQLGGKWEGGICKFQNNDPSNDVLDCGKLGGSWIDTEKRCDFLRPSTDCEKLGGKWDDQAKKCSIPADEICELQKNIFFQSKAVGEVKEFCKKKYKIIMKVQSYYQSENGIAIPNPSYSIDSSNEPVKDNIIPNTLTLYLAGAGGGGGGGSGAKRYGHGGYKGEVKIIPLDSINVKVGSTMDLLIGKGGAGSTSDGVFGGNTNAIIYSSGLGNFPSNIKISAKGGAGGDQKFAEANETKRFYDSTNDNYGCFGEPLGEFGRLGNFNGGLCTMTQSGASRGGPGQYGSGGGGGNDDSGGNGGNGVAALTWLEWCDVGVNCP